MQPDIQDLKDFIVRFKHHIKNGNISSVTHKNACNKIRLVILIQLVKHIKIIIIRTNSTKICKINN